MSAPRDQIEQPENVSITRSEMWHSDGSVVLQAASTQFRVHWSVLAMHSTVFRDLQGLPQPPEQPTVEMCPVVELSDHPDDVEYLLKALYIPIFHCQKVLPFPVVAAFIRLGRKYDFKDIFDSAMARLTSEYPATLEDFDAFPGKSLTIERYPGLTADIITLAREQNILPVLPWAYYWAVSVSFRNLSELLDGFEKADGTRVSLLPVDLRRCLIGQQKLLMKQFQPGYTFGWARKWEFTGCTSVAQCLALRQVILTYHLDSDRAHFRALLKPGALGDYVFCPSCTRHIHECMTAGRKKIWEELPAIFDLPPWSELKNDM
ncbi:hypothetical protein K438DRAFT_1658397 [Mycena galopus ATCC 62051]|nr:hypothetical protein K438DRAFT_1658397 [Mycena galopus ATCC 62051]